MKDYDLNTQTSVHTYVVNENQIKLRLEFRRQVQKCDQRGTRKVYKSTSDFKWRGKQRIW
jgi:hypothetical protein